MRTWPAVAINRRQRNNADPVTTFDDGTLHVDFAHQEVSIDGMVIVLTQGSAIAPFIYTLF